MDNRQKPEDLKILVVSQNHDECENLRELLEAKSYFVQTAANGSEALNYFEQITFDLVFTKLLMPKVGGRELLSRLKERFPEVFVVLLTGDATTELAVMDTVQGAFNYILKPPYQKSLFPLINTVAEHKRFLKSNLYAHEERRKNYRFENIIGKTPQMLEIFHKIQDVAKANILVLVTGETGTGKELVADAIHYSGPRRNEPLVKINCASLSDALVESELFGHEKGAFTTAITQKKGKFELANRGTLFLDEIGEMPIHMQAKLLRVLDDGSFDRVGGMRTIYTDVRIICATNKNIHQELKEKRLREDLFYRIKAASIHLPPLRERKDDIPLLADYFVRRSCRRNNKKIVDLSKKSHKILRAFNWPGNVRELMHVIDQAVVFCKGKEITPARLPEDIQKKKPQPKEFSLRLSSRSLSLAESTLILKVLEETNWNLKLAARELQIARGTLYSKMTKYEIIRPA
jgi:DNA-binding NtrC family response regulator